MVIHVWDMFGNSIIYWLQILYIFNTLFFLIRTGFVLRCPGVTFLSTYWTYNFFWHYIGLYLALYARKKCNTIHPKGCCYSLCVYSTSYKYNYRFNHVTSQVIKTSPIHLYCLAISKKIWVFVSSMRAVFCYDFWYWQTISWNPVPVLCSPWAHSLSSLFATARCKPMPG